MKKILFEELPINTVVLKTVRKGNDCIIWLEDFHSGFFYKVIADNGKFTIYRTKEIEDIHDGEN